MGPETSQTAGKAKKKSGIARWLSELRSWVAVSEPSGQAFEQHKKEMYKSKGVSLKDPQASAKLHVPATTIPKEAIRPAGPGPDPEELAAARRRSRTRHANSSASRSTQSYSTTSSEPGWKPEPGLRSPRSPG
ncbi:hypothetical protein J7T55_008544 [Diaporthe amygdali]|uniref:uncharacterized protein n=1 Tax=Phomopsis amygdali TaxID=1214568 RepID=UPI0022FE8155|nr:uncharacterized protein J7T55_008544 [Diaporthe amygdali]KAJ0121380.1 hypothetical protein J7T55_008544 [Diaporthe amygdali]